MPALLGLLIIGTARCACAADDASEDAVDLERLLNEMTSFRAEFEQTVVSRFGEILQESTGRMHLLRPGRLRWEVDEPYPQLVLSDGERVWVYDPDLEQVTVQPLADTVDGSPAVFLTGAVAEVDVHFSVQVDGADADADGKRFVLTPRDEASPSSSSLFRNVALTFSSAGSLTSLDVVDHLDQTTRVVFVAAEHNPVLESELFDFEVPQGVDVIGNVPANPAPG